MTDKSPRHNLRHCIEIESHEPTPSVFQTLALSALFSFSSCPAIHCRVSPFAQRFSSHFREGQLQTTVSQKLTEAGVLGVILMIIGPVVAGFAFMSIASAGRFDGVAPDVTWLYLVGLGGSLLTVLSLPLVIVGRRYIVESASQ